MRYAERMTPSTSEKRLLDYHREPFRVLVTLGESTTAGSWSSTRDRCWASVLDALISDFQDVPVTLFNAGIGANVISDRVSVYPYSGKPAANERIRKHVVDHAPDLLVISYGLNDAGGGMPVEFFRSELMALIRSVRKACDLVIVLLGPYFMTAFYDYPYSIVQAKNVRVLQFIDETGSTEN